MKLRVILMALGSLLEKIRKMMMMRARTMTRTRAMTMRVVRVMRINTLYAFSGSNWVSWGVY
jgi:hypothetical protein